MLLFIGASEIFFVILFVVMLFGANKIPEIAKGLGKMMREVKDASNEIKREIKDSTKEIKNSTKEIKDNIDKYNSVPFSKITSKHFMPALEFSINESKSSYKN